MDIIEDLRKLAEPNDSDTANALRDAASMLEFFFDQMQVASCKMDGEHHYRIRGGWPMTHAVGESPEMAIRAAMAEVRRSKEEMDCRAAE